MLHHISIGNQDPQSPLALVIHGIMGSHKNWLTFAKQLSELYPAWRFILIDLPEHGASSPLAKDAYTLDACVQALDDFFTQIGQKPSLVIGHSFGGKIALAYAKAHDAELKAAWILDAVPGHLSDKPVSASTADSVAAVIRVLKELKAPFQSRLAFSQALEEKGVGKKVALWMTTNLKEEKDGLHLVFDVQAIRSMLKDYAEQDFWPYLHDKKRQVHLSFVRAEYEARWTREALAHFDAVASQSTALYLLPKSGHWVHIDQPQALLALMKAAFSV